MTLLWIGITASAAWVIAGLLISGSGKTKGWLSFASATFALYFAVAVFYSQSFSIVILNYLPAMIALLGGSLYRYLQTSKKRYLYLSIGVLISLVAAGAQQAGLSIHPQYFNHNATYHLIQALGLLFLFKGAKEMITTERHLT
ncbi:hypothetical protein K2X33_08685 [bacterium]|nr:hypothetical protein [bacterium]